MRRANCLWGFVVGAFALCAPTVSLAEALRHEQNRLVVAVPEESTGLPAQELVAALRGQLAEMGVEVVLSSRPFDVSSDTDSEVAQESALAFVWLGKEGEVLAIHFFESDGATLRKRRVPLRGTDAASLEEVALVVRSAVSALLERRENELSAESPSQEVAVAPRPYEEETSAEQPVSDSQQQPSFWLGLGWVGQRYAPEVSFAHGVQAVFGLRPTGANYGLGMSYQLLPAERSTTDLVSITVQRHPLEAFFSWESTTVRTPVFIGAQSGVMVDILRRTTVVSGPDLEPSPGASRASWALTARALLGIRLGPQITLQGHAGADVLVGRVIVALEDGQVLLQPHRIRPRLSALLSWNFP